MGRKKVNKSQKIRDMFGEMGLEAKPSEVVAALRQRRVKVSPNMVSIIKGQLKRGEGPSTREGAAEPARKGKRKTSPAADATRLSVKDVLEVQDLAKRLSPKALRLLVEAFGG